jgi:hypothetical protein
LPGILSRRAYSLCFNSIVEGQDLSDSAEKLVFTLRQGERGGD